MFPSTSFSCGLSSEKEGCKLSGLVTSSCQLQLGQRRVTLALHINSPHAYNKAASTFMTLVLNSVKNAERIFVWQKSQSLYNFLAYYYIEGKSQSRGIQSLRNAQITILSRGYVNNISILRG